MEIALMPPPRELRIVGFLYLDGVTGPQVQEAWNALEDYMETFRISQINLHWPHPSQADAQNEMVGNIQSALANWQLDPTMMHAKLYEFVRRYNVDRIDVSWKRTRQKIPLDPTAN